MHLFNQAVVSVIATPLIGYTQDKYDLFPETNPKKLGKFLAVMTIVPCMISIPLFLIGGCKFRNKVIASAL